MSITWRLREEEAVVFEHTHLSEERFKTVCKLATYGIVGAVAIVAITVTGGWGVLGIGCLGFMGMALKAGL